MGKIIAAAVAAYAVLLAAFLGLWRLAAGAWPSPPAILGAVAALWVVVAFGVSPWLRLGGKGRFCPACRGPVPAGAILCPHCGRAVA